MYAYMYMYNFFCVVLVQKPLLGVIAFKLRVFLDYNLIVCVECRMFISYLYLDNCSCL